MTYEIRLSPPELRQAILDYVEKRSGRTDLRVPADGIDIPYPIETEPGPFRWEAVIRAEHVLDEVKGDGHCEGLCRELASVRK